MMFKIIRIASMFGIGVTGFMWATDIISFSQNEIIDSITGLTLLVQLLFISYAEFMSNSVDTKERERANRCTVGIVVSIIAILLINPFLEVVYGMFI